MDNRKYWLRGLIAGATVYVLFLIVFVGYAKEAAAYMLPTVALYVSPTIPIGLFLGWMYGKMPKTAILLSIAMVILLIALEMFIFKNTFTPRPYDPQAELEKALEGMHQAPCLGAEKDNPFAKCYEPN